MAHSQEAAQLHNKLKDLKAKWAELQDVLVVVAERKSSSIEQISNLEANVRSKTKKVATADEKRARIEERFKKFMEQNREHTGTDTNLDRSYGIVRAENDQLQYKN